MSVSARVTPITLEPFAFKRHRLVKVRNPLWPAVDEPLATPEVHEEILEGKKVHVMSAKEPHARKHSQLLALLELHAAEGFVAAADMLTRVDATSDIAPDAAIYPETRDEHGHRQIERIAFEILDSTRKNQLALRASKLSKRGVRRIFGIHVKKGEAFEWNATLHQWVDLPHDFKIDDACLVRPLSVSALLNASKPHNEVAQALLAQHNEVLEEAMQQREVKGEAKGKIEGKIEGLREGEAKGRLEGERAVLLKLVRVKFGAVSDSVRARIESAAADELERWAERVLTASSVEDVLRA